MNLPSNIRSLVVLGIFCAVAGAWLTFVTEARTRSLSDPNSAGSTSIAPPTSASGLPPRSTDTSLAGSTESLHARRAIVGPMGAPSGAARKIGAEGPPAAPTDAERVASARRQLEFLELQKPENFLAIFDVMKQENGGNPKQLETARAESHRYIIARTKVLERMLRRFIDDPGADQGLEKDALASLDETFRAKVDSLARDMPAVANIQEILTTTTLKAPPFAEPPADEPEEPSEDVVDRHYESDQSSIQSPGAAHDQSSQK
jgi:hypothetical protein